MKSAAKLKDEARKHEQREEWDRAIQIYMQVLRGEEDSTGESELPLYNRIGDLYVRLGKPADAVKFYEQAADRYSEAGLYNNAIALCNKALRYQPARLSLFRKLGQFCARQGFLTDARRWYLDFADRMFKQGDLDEAFNALDDFATISDDPDARLHLGRKLHAHDRLDDSLEEFRRAYATFVRTGQDESAEAVRREVLELFPAGPDLADEALAGTDGSFYSEDGPGALPTFGDAPSVAVEEVERPPEEVEATDAEAPEGFQGTQLADAEEMEDVEAAALAGLDTGRDDTLERLQVEGGDVTEALEPETTEEDDETAHTLPLLDDEGPATTEAEPAAISGLPLLDQHEPPPSETVEAEELLASDEPPAPASQAPPAASDDYVDLYALLAPDEDRVETTRFFIQESEPTGDEDHDFAELLNEFRAKLAEHVPEHDAGSHYDLGLAFKEMGLTDDAISEFQIALRAGQDRLKVFEELGQCFIQKEQYNIAVKVLSRALQFEHHDELELIGVYYFLGRAYEELGHLPEARDAYERVMGLDIRFQDVQHRVARL